MSERVPSEKKCEKVACKHCGKEFAYILKHLANASICKSVYQEDELNSLRLFSKSISDANKKIKAWNNYKSEDRAKKYSYGKKLNNFFNWRDFVCACVGPWDKRRGHHDQESAKEGLHCGAESERTH